MMFVYAVRVDISVAIVCMVKKKYKNHTYSNDTECELPEKSASGHVSPFFHNICNLLVLFCCEGHYTNNNRERTGSISLFHCLLID